MTPQQRAILNWRDWNSEHTQRGRVEMIPPEMQAGKVLEFCILDTNEAIRFAEEQSQYDVNKSLDDGYWTKVKKILVEMQVNDIMMGE